ncbi:winged helix-turn-helix transcriptional regulator [Streptomyces sp. NPDC051677]|uniref:winged helix-turn-helix transcriptional regulator n=1 Tax=Streptomyces sp. NPDC051677 TaxID=3365669 RepID=UPI0037D277A3
MTRPSSVDPEIDTPDAGRVAPPVSTPAEDAYCSIERTIAIIGDRWTLLILREVLIFGLTRFADLTASIGIAPNVLTNRLDRLTQCGVLEQRDYRDAGSRTRQSYHPTEAGLELRVLLAALGQWGDDFIPPESGVSATRELQQTGQQVRLGFVTDETLLTPTDEVAFVPAV